MKQRPLNGFRFSLRYSPNIAATEMRELIVLAVARLPDDAAALARGKCPRNCSAHIIGSGPTVLKEAQLRGLREGGAIVVLEHEADETDEQPSSTP